MASEQKSVERLLAEAYFKLLNGIDWSDPLVVAGIREGLNKFLSNAFASMFLGVHEYRRTHLISADALAQVDAKDYRNLIYEHLVPKTRYIQRPCEQLAKQKLLTVDFAMQQLEKYWRVATITKLEDDRLHRRKMPDNWDGIDVFARYDAVGISLLPNPFYPPNCENFPAADGTADV